MLKVKYSYTKSYSECYLMLLHLTNTTIFLDDIIRSIYFMSFLTVVMLFDFLSSTKVHTNLVGWNPEYIKAGSLQKGDEPSTGLQQTTTEIKLTEA